MMPLRRVCVTGRSAISAAGDTPDALWEAVTAGRSLARPFREDADEPCPWSVARVALEPGADVPSAVRRDLDRAGWLLYLAVMRAWTDAGLDGCAPERRTDAGVVAASSAGSLGAALDAYGRWRDGAPAVPRDVLRAATGLAAAVAADHLGALGPVLHLTGGSVSGLCALGEAWLKVATGQLDCCVAVAAEAPLHPAVLAQFGAARLLAEGGPEACRPFDRGRRGTQLGEGAAALVLESEASATERGARVHGFVEGYGAASDGAHQTIAPDAEGRGLARAIAAAMRMAGRSPAEVDVVMLHGTGTTLNDAAEGRALGAAFGDVVPAAAATKPITGHCLGACGAMEAVIALAALAHGVVPPTANLDDPDLALRVGVWREPRRAALRVAMINAVGFGGRNAALVLSRWDAPPGRAASVR